MTALHRSILAAIALWALAAFGYPDALWRDPAGRLRPDARDAVALLERSAAEGFDPRDYPVPTGDASDFDSTLTTSMLRYLEDLRFGRVDPRALGFRMPPRESIDVAAALREAVGSRRLDSLAGELSPQIPMYAQLRHELARYKALATDARVNARDDVPSLLVMVGDLPVDAARDSDAVTKAVRRFQARHGLEPDGVVGPATRRALAVPWSWRARQIELSLERLRWLPRFPPQRILAVNIPMFRVWGMGDARAPLFSAGVIVGRSLRTRTPVLLESMEYVIFRPYWNIPGSILHGEILPAVRRSPGYLDQHGMEIVAGDSDSGRIVPPTAENIAGLGAGTLRLRQRPGPQNSLGLVKFVFPNDANVYMHGTPAPALFARARRDFSHGCIRVSDPVGLAEWVLRGDPAWTRERIVAAMNGRSPLRVDLGRPIPVILFYTTAMPIDGAMHFADDIYGHDAQLDRHLQAARGRRPATE